MGDLSYIFLYLHAAGSEGRRIQLMLNLRQTGELLNAVALTPLRGCFIL